MFNFLKRIFGKDKEEVAKKTRVQQDSAKKNGKKSPALKNKIDNSKSAPKKNHKKSSVKKTSAQKK